MRIALEATMSPSAIIIEPAMAEPNKKDAQKCPLDAALELEKEAASLLDPLYKIIEQPIGTRRPIKVACMGAGYSGLMMSIVFSERMKDSNAELVIYERNEDLGGTWLENRYEIYHQRSPFSLLQDMKD